MCYPKPGPRCSSHAQARFFAKQRDEFAAKAVLHQVIDVVRAEDGSTDNDARVVAAREQLRKASFDKAEAAHELSTTPAGIRQSEQALARLEADPEPSAARTEEIETLRGKIDRAKRTRQTQLDAYRAAQGAPASTGWSPEAEDPQFETRAEADPIPHRDQTAPTQTPSSSIDTGTKVRVLPSMFAWKPDELSDVVGQEFTVDARRVDTVFFTAPDGSSAGADVSRFEVIG